MRSFPIALVLVGCALAHERPSPPDAGSPSDAFVVTTRCALGRSEIVIEAPPARRAGFSLRLDWPHASTDGARIVATAEVISDAQGGIGSSDILTYDASGGPPRAFFTTDLPYVLGTVPGLEEFLESGGFASDRVVAEVRRFANDRFELVRSDDSPSAIADPPIDVALPNPDPTFSIFEVARDGAGAVRFDDHRGIVVYDVSASEAHEQTVIPLATGVALLSPAPRLSPSGRRVAFRTGIDRTVLSVLELETSSLRTYPLGVIRAVAFLDDARLLVQIADRDVLDVLDVATGTTQPLDLSLPAIESDDVFDAIDVSANAETFVRMERDGRQLRIVRCDPALRVLRP